MSNRAVAAYDRGLMPAGKIAQALRSEGFRVNGAWVKENFTAREWHHTSSKFNETEFFDLDQVLAEIAANREKFETSAAEFAANAKARKDTGEIIADVVVTEWRRVAINHFGKLANRKFLHHLTAVKVSPAGATMWNIPGWGRIKNVVVTPVSPVELKRRARSAAAKKAAATRVLRAAAAATVAKISAPAPLLLIARSPRSVATTESAERRAEAIKMKLYGANVCDYSAARPQPVRRAIWELALAVATGAMMFETAVSKTGDLLAGQEAA